MSDPRRQIIAIGGGGLSTEPENAALDRYVLAQARRSNPAVCFLATAKRRRRCAHRTILCSVHEISPPAKP